jgi:hypothetical protein
MKQTTDMTANHMLIMFSISSFFNLHRYRESLQCLLEACTTTISTTLRIIAVALIS